ncbi:MAG TPA: cobalamin B12-binding domain-containing protein [bacterium]|nr:cobalamin B12-binding domain-containing protein [bacterium]
MSNATRRIVIAKPGLDGHDRGAKVVAMALRDAGFQVIYLGRRKTPAQIVQAAVQEDADYIGLSILSGSHVPLTEKLFEQLRANNASDIKVLVGGTIPEQDIGTLLNLGVSKVFPTGATMAEIVEFIDNN